MVFPYGTPEENENFCRAATGADIGGLFREPWCYTDKGADACNINYCGMHKIIGSVFDAEKIHNFCNPLGGNII